MKTTLTALLLCIAAATGCNAAHPVYVDMRFTSAEQAQIQAAADDWMAHGSEPIDLVFGVHMVDNAANGRSIWRAESTAEAAALLPRAAKQDVNGVTHSQALGPAVTIVINMERVTASGDGVAEVVTHEMGHMLGCADLDGSDAIMSLLRNSDSPKALTGRDVAELRRIQ